MRKPPYFLRRASVWTALVAGLSALLLLTVVGGAQAQDRSRGKQRSIPFVSITKNDKSTRYFETNAIPLLIGKACFGWRMWLGGPDRSVQLVEVLQTSQPAKDVIAGPETEVNAEKTR